MTDVTLHMCPVKLSKTSWNVYLSNFQHPLVRRTHYQLKAQQSFFWQNNLTHCIQSFATWNQNHSAVSCWRVWDQLHFNKPFPYTFLMADTLGFTRGQRRILHMPYKSIIHFNIIFENRHDRIHIFPWIFIEPLLDFYLAVSDRQDLKNRLWSRCTT